MDKKYYFVTYTAASMSGSATWNETTDKHPVQFIIDVSKAQQKSQHSHFNNFVLLNSLELTEEEYNLYNDEF